MVELEQRTTQLKLTSFSGKPSRRAYSPSTTSPNTCKFLSRLFISGVTGARAPTHFASAGTSGLILATSTDGSGTARLRHRLSGSSPTPPSAVCGRAGRAGSYEVGLLATRDRTNRAINIKPRGRQRFVVKPNRTRPSLNGRAERSHRCTPLPVATRRAARMLLRTR